MRYVWCALILLACTACSLSPEAQLPAVLLESHSPAISADGVLLESVGIETLGGVLTPILEKGCRLPCEASSNFGNASDNQTAFRLHVYRGNVNIATQGYYLGTAIVSGLAPQAQGQAHIKLTFIASGNDLLIRAIEIDTRKPLTVVVSKEEP
jgi:molecular chaperone DnaK (HSP70)